MCGIAGFVDFRCQTSNEDLRGIAKRMTDTLSHRGPDGEGVWVDASAGVVLGHRRLAVIDLSPTGRQPMVSGSGRFIIVYNGEVYNFQELRKELQCQDPPTVLRGTADTEVMLACFDRWGVEAALPRFNGMFAFAVWDAQERILHLCRDRMGEKPLYYGWMGDTFLFGSELKALRAHPVFRAAIDRNALTLYMRYNCVPAPHSIYCGIHKLLPGNLFSLSLGSASNAKSRPYWSLGDAVLRARESPFLGSAEDAVDRLDSILKDAIRLRMLSDVPLGAFLSGGVDSSTVTALMQAQSSRPVKTFTVGLFESAYDESKSAGAVARHLGVEYAELYVTPAEVLSVIPKLPLMYDEPFADSSQIPTFLVSQMARQHVTVGLSGDGGDELFGGYNRHVWSNRIWDRLQRIPLPARSIMAEVIRRVPTEAWDRVWDFCDPFLPEKAKHRNPGSKLHKIADMLSVKNREALYLRQTSHWTSPADVVIGGTEPSSLMCGDDLDQLLPDFVQQMMFLDTTTYLPDDILTKVDRATMAVSLEARVPFLDHRLVEFAWSLPPEFKIRDGQGKWLVRELLYRYVPKKLVDRPKMGFGVPLDSWLRGPLRYWAEELLEERLLQDDGLFKPAAIRSVWAEHLSGRSSRQHQLWNVLMFQAWMAENRRTDACQSVTRASEPNREYTVPAWS